MSMIIAEGRSAERKRKKRQCLVIGCTNHKANGALCAKHEHERRKERNPYQYWYSVLRRNAKRRGKVFTITLEYFTQFCKETNYINVKGRKSGSMTIDRIIDELGYIEGNIRILEVGENSRKQYTDYWKHHTDQTWVETPIDVSDISPEKPQESGSNNLPF